MYTREHYLSTKHKYGISRMYAAAKYSAKKRGIEFNLSRDYFRQLCVSTVYCPISGVELDYTFYNSEGNAGKRDNRASLDRIDNTKGYEKGNVWLISWRMNRIKADASLSELQALVAALEARQATVTSNNASYTSGSH